MNRIARVFVVGAYYGAIGGLLGAVVGLFLGAIFGVIFGKLMETIVQAVSYCVVLYALMLSFAAVLSDEGESFDVFRMKREEMSKPTVLFLCTNNAARSQMAEALLRTKAPETFDVYSAGTDPKPSIDPLTVRVMSEVGIDVSRQHPKGLLEYLGRLPVRVAISVCPRTEDKCPTMWPGAMARIEWPFEDPAACQGSEDERLEKFRRVRNQIDQKITDWLAEMTAGK